MSKALSKAMAALLLVSLLSAAGSFCLPGQQRVSIVFAGDAMQHSSQLDAARRGSLYDYSDCFSELEHFIKGADYAVVNLETTLAARNFTGYPCFRSPDSFALALKNAGFDMMLTANNHCLDNGDFGLRRTIKVLDTLGVPHLGTYSDSLERSARLPLICNIGGIRVAFLNYTYGTNGFEVRDGAVVDYIDTLRMRGDIALAREKGAEILCVAVHWGEEYKLLPNSAQESVAEFFAGEGVDLIIGGHPHVIQPMKVTYSPAFRKNILTVYSLGNFISGMKTTDTRGGVMVRVWLERDVSGYVHFSGAEYLPVFVVKGVPGVDNFKLRVADSCDTQYARDFLRNAYAIFNKHNVGVPRLQE
ncbi:MAG: CapA family protein [Bacteroidales bacterium]|nr:CapA family protein [Bacteroidales bacterium]